MVGGSNALLRIATQRKVAQVKYRDWITFFVYVVCVLSSFSKGRGPLFMSRICVVRSTNEARIRLVSPLSLYFILLEPHEDSNPTRMVIYDSNG